MFFCVFWRYLWVFFLGGGFSLDPILVVLWLCGGFWLLGFLGFVQILVLMCLKYLFGIIVQFSVANSGLK